VPTEEQLFTVQETAHRLNVSEDTVYRSIRSGTLDAVKIRNAIRVTPQAITDMLGRRRYTDLVSDPSYPARRSLGDRMRFWERKV
jgi:excisionase family DNA binding protein